MVAYSAHASQDAGFVLVNECLFASFQSYVTTQTSNLSSLVTKLKTTIGATHETSTSLDPASDALVEEEHNSSLLLIRYGPFTLLRDQAKRHIKGTNLLAMSMANRLPTDDLKEVTRDVS